MTSLDKFQGEWGPSPQWDDYGPVYQRNLINALKTYTHLKFDHIKVGCLGRKICVFVVKGDQSAVLYDKTRSFPSAKLLASLVLLGSP